MARVVWIDGWQMQCCGDPIAVGENVVLTTVVPLDREYMAAVLGQAAAAETTHSEERHCDMDAEGVGEVEGIVRSISAISCRYAPRDGVHYPVPGTTVLEPRSIANGQERPTDDVRFVGYVVTLD